MTITCTNEHRVCADGTSRPAGEVFGYDEITRQYFDRYRLPVMHTETNHLEGPTRPGGGELAVEGMGQCPPCTEQWRAHRRLHLVQPHRPGRLGHGPPRAQQPVNALGLYDLDRNIRNVGRAYRQLISDWRNVLPTQSLCLTVPVVMPGEGGDVHAETQRDRARDMAEGANPQPSTQSS